MVRIRHPNLFVDKCDGNVKILLVHSDKKRSACRNLFFIFLCISEKNSEMFYENWNQIMEKLENYPDFSFSARIFRI
jgi:hypothetical protein